MRLAETRPWKVNRVERARDSFVMNRQAVVVEYATRDLGRMVPRSARKLRMFILCLTCNGEARDLKRPAQSDGLFSLIYQRHDWVTCLIHREKASIGVVNDVDDLSAAVKR